MSKEIFSTYECRSVDRGQPHPGDIAEPASLSAIALPPSDYPLWDALPPEASKLYPGGLPFIWCSDVCPGLERPEARCLYLRLTGKSFAC